MIGHGTWAPGSYIPLLNTLATKILLEVCIDVCMAPSLPYSLVVDDSLLSSTTFAFFRAAVCRCSTCVVTKDML